ncbi:N-formylglutamate amidohydrolase [Tsuneonella sp. YG55]|uniref:N-formylglutamate amidohydrolase n=1 Tax=Tsuneonella litorea TaxID=2976475 RepID=A0A9X2VYF1_9SPHN|nr:N-formylglutamate amidohydrolase [Tsuneonella litorea]
MPPVRGDSPFVLVGDHAGSAIPTGLGDLGLGAADRARHIAVDLGSRALGDALARTLAAPFVSQVYSRLVIDCNRDPARADSIVPESDGTRIPGNVGLSAPAREARRTEILEPYQAAIAEMLDARPDPILIALHSFTPVMGGAARPWEIGVLHDGRRNDFALRVLRALHRRGDLVVGDNEPYRMDDTDYTVPRHAYSRGLRYAEIEVRQDLLADDAGTARIAAILAGAFGAALEP